MGVLYKAAFISRPKASAIDLVTVKVLNPLSAASSIVSWESFTSESAGSRRMRSIGPFYWDSAHSFFQGLDLCAFCIRLLRALTAGLHKQAQGECDRLAPSAGTVLIHASRFLISSIFVFGCFNPSTQEVVLPKLICTSHMLLFLHCTKCLVTPTELQSARHVIVPRLSIANAAQRCACELVLHQPTPLKIFLTSGDAYRAQEHASCPARGEVSCRHRGISCRRASAPRLQQ